MTLPILSSRAATPVHSKVLQHAQQTPTMASTPPGSDSPSAPTEEQLKRSIFHRAKAWGDSPVPPTLLATLIAPLHLRPLAPLPLFFSPALLFASYLNLQGHTKDAAGTTAAWSALYSLLARRRKHQIRERFSARGAVRGAALLVAAMNVAGGAVAYVFGTRDAEPKPLVGGSNEARKK